jgi:phage-related tail protein
MAIAKAYAVAELNEQQQLEPYIAAQRKLNDGLANRGSEYQIAKFTDASDRVDTVLQCSMLPTNEQLLFKQVDAVWVHKMDLMREHVEYLNKLHSELANEAKWKVGEPGGAPELITYLAEVAKTTTDLIQDLTGLSGTKLVGTGKNVYEAIEKGRKAYEIVSEDTQKVVEDAILDATSKRSPVARSVKAIKDFSDNIREMLKTSEHLGETREEVKRQLEMLDRQIRKMELSIEKIRREHELDEVKLLLRSAQKMQAPEISRP